MINLKLNNQNYEIPTYKELTVKQFIELRKRKDTNLINYLSVVTGLRFADIWTCKVNRPHDLAIRIGKYMDYTERKPGRRILVDDKTHFLPESMEIETVGQRFTIEENGKNLKDEEYLCFVLAVGLLGNEMDYNKINSLKDKIMNQPYINVLPAGFFLLKNLWIGNDIEMRGSLSPVRLIKIVQLKSRLALIALRRILITLKFRH